MKILMLLTNPFKPDDRVNNEANSLIEAGHNVTIFAWDREGKFEKKEKFNGIKLIRFKLKTGYSSKKIVIPMIIFQLWLLIKLINKRTYDAIHCHDLDTLWPGILAAKIRGKKVIFDAHEDFPGQSRVFMPKFVAVFLEWFEKKLVHKVDGFVSPHPYMIDKYRDCAADKALVMNCKSLSRIVKDKKKIDKLKKSLGIENKFVLMFTGVATRYRMVLETAKAMHKSKSEGVCFLILGSFLDETGERIRKYIDGKKVIHVNSVSLDELPKYMQLGDVFHCFQDPSNQNYKIAIPNKLFDAMTGEKPIIVAEGQACAEIVRSENCGKVVKYGDIESLLKEVEWCRNHFEELQAMGIRARNAVEREYNWEEMGRRLVKLYEKISK